MWKDIYGWEDFYEISDSGEVRNKKTKRIKKSSENSAGYFRVNLYNKNHIPKQQKFFIHRLVAEHFIPNQNNLPEVNHKDHNLSHNFVSNLNWCTREENELDSRMYGSKEYKPFKVVFENGDISVFDTKPQLAKILSVTRGLIGHWLRRTSNTYINYGIKSIEYIN